MATDPGQDPSRAAWKEWREWLTTIAVIVGIIVGTYQWWLKEVLFPGSAPVNVTTDVTVKQAGSRATQLGKDKSELEAIEVIVTARNPSTREIYLLNNFWAASGMTIQARQQEGAARRRSMLAAVGAIDSTLYADQQIFSGKHFRLDRFEPVASGVVFPRGFRSAPAGKHFTKSRVLCAEGRLRCRGSRRGFADLFEGETGRQSLVGLS